MKVVPLTEKTLKAAHHLEELCFSQPWTLQGIEEELNNPNALYLIVEEEGQVLGYGGLQFAASEFYITNIAVHPDHRRKGVGRALVKALVGWADQQDGEFVSLEVRPSNLGAIRLYESLGFVQVGQRKNFYSCPKEDGLILTLTLAGGKS